MAQAEIDECVSMKKGILSEGILTYGNVPNSVGCYFGMQNTFQSQCLLFGDYVKVYITTIVLY